MKLSEQKNKMELNKSKNIKTHQMLEPNFPGVATPQSSLV